MRALAKRRGSAVRRGVTLVELMVLMTAVAVMLGVCVTTLGLAMRLEADGRAAFERSETLGRLARLFRTDVHEARDASLDGGVLRLTAPRARRVEYHVGEGGDVSRVVVDGEKEAAREPFRVPQSVGARLEIREIDGRRFAALTVDVQPRRDRADPVRPREILASLRRPAPPQPEGGRP